MISRVQNILFCVTVAVVLCAVLGNVAMIASVTNDEKDRKSYLEGRSYQPLPELTVESIASGSFQKLFESFVSDAVPHRDEVIMRNAQLQELIIDAANIPFQFPAVPTFFDSAYVYSPSLHVISEAPVKRSRPLEDSLHQSAAVLGGFMESYPDVNWCMALVDRDSGSRSNPAYELVSDAVDGDYLQREFVDKLPSVCAKVDLKEADQGAYYDSYFQTDHHWRIQGAIAAYGKIAAAFGFEPVPTEYFTAYKGPFYGSNARNGLCVKADDFVDDVRYDRSNLVVRINGSRKEESIDWLDASWASGSKKYKKAHEYSSVYAEYFHGDPGLFSIENLDNRSNRALLIVGDSYTNNIERLFAEHYRFTYVIDPRYYEKSIATFIDKHTIDDALFIWGFNTATNSIVIEQFAGEVG